mgnify:CR=1 FL=1
MADRARFDVILGDQVSGAAGRATVAMKGLEASFRSVARLNASAWRRDQGIMAAQARARVRADVAAARGGGGFFDGLFGRGGRADTMLGGVGRFGLMAAGLASVARVGMDVASTFGRIAYSAGSAYLSVASFRQDSIAGLTTVLGNQRAATNAFRNALVMANQTPLDPQDVIGTFTSLAVGGFRESELAPLTAAAADIQAARGQAASDALVRVFSQMRGLGRVQRGDITMQAITAGLNAGDIFEDIARQMNLGTGRAGIQAAERAVSRGRVNDTVAINAFLASVRRRYDRGGALGTFARNQSNTLTGALSNLRGAGFTLLASTDLSRTAGVQAVTRTVLGLVQALDMGSATGIRLRRVIVGFSDAALTGLFGGGDAGTIEGVFNTVLDVAEGVTGFLRIALPIGRQFVGGVLVGMRAGFTPVLVALRAIGGADAGRRVEVIAVSFGYLGRAIGFVVGVVGTGAAVVTSFVGVIASAGAGITALTGYALSGLDTLTTRGSEWGYQAALSIVTGFETGFLDAGGRVVGAVERTFEGAVQSARTVLDWHSPSGVFRDAGDAVSRGFELGIAGGAPAARDAVSRLVAPQGAAGVGAEGGGRATATITMIIDGARDPRAVAREAVAELVDALEVLRVQGAPALAPGGVSDG